MKVNFKDVVCNKKVAICGLVTAVSTAVMALPAFASGEGATVDLSGAFTTGLNSASSEFNKYLVILVPIAIGIMVGPFAIRKGISLFKSLANK